MSSKGRLWILISIDAETEYFVWHSMNLKKYTHTMCILMNIIRKLEIPITFAIPSIILRHLRKMSYLHMLRHSYLDVASLCEIASHSHTHRPIDMLSRTEAFREFLISKRILENVFETKVYGFIYPAHRIKYLDLLYESGYLYTRTRPYNPLGLNPLNLLPCTIQGLLLSRYVMDLVGLKSLKYIKRFGVVLIPYNFHYMCIRDEDSYYLMKNFTKFRSNIIRRLRAGGTYLLHIVLHDFDLYRPRCLEMFLRILHHIRSMIRTDIATSSTLREFALNG